jgi:hypothetical protein
VPVFRASETHRFPGTSFQQGRVALSLNHLLRWRSARGMMRRSPQST